MIRLHSTMLVSSALEQSTVNLMHSRDSSSAKPSSQTTSLPIKDNVEISQEAKDKSSGITKSGDQDSEQDEKVTLSQQELSQLRYLKQRDTEVRSHEQAHLSTAGRYAQGSAHFVYQKGPDGASYAIGGEVSISTSNEANPEATITKMQTIKRAALAPLRPSSTDRSVAAQATAKEMAARQQIIVEQHEALLGESEATSSNNNGIESSSHVGQSISAYEEMSGLST